MSIVLTFSIIFLLSFSVSELFKKSFLEGLPCAVSIIVLVLYISGFAGAMNIAAYLLMALPFASFAAIVIVRRGKLNLSPANIGGMFVFAAVFAYFWYIGRGSMIYEYDEFSHWALVVKNMFLYNNFGNLAPTTATFLTYPPAQGLFEYFFLKICRSYNESRMILATNVFLVAFILPAFRKARNIFGLCAGTVLSLSLMFYINNGVFRSTYVDMLVGVIWGYIIITFFDTEKDIFSTVSLSLALAVITLVKASGFGLAIGSAIIFAVYQFVSAHRENQPVIPAIKQLLLPFAALLASKFSWSAFVKLHHLEEKFQFNSVTFDSVMALFNGTAPQYRQQTLANFADALTGSSVFSLHINITPLLIIIVPFVVLTAVYLSAKDRYKTSFGAAVTLLTVSVIYTFGLLFSYLFSFTQYEAVSLASFGRYLTTIAAGAAIVMAYFLYDFLAKSGFKAAVPAVVALCIAISPAAVMDNAAYYNEMNGWANSFRGIYDWENQLVAKHCPADSTMLYMAPGSADLVRLHAQYAFTPVSILYPYNFSPDGEMYYEDSAGPLPYTVQEIRQHLKENCDYVFLHKALPEFVEDYRELFCTDIITEGLYKVDKTNGNLTVVELLQ
ncbi:MAG: hypothetical protein E7484_01720 [Ruminococcaceae bacterium]|nr:hypothetical protein [Oscillospiraceae bacterium]